MRLTLAAICLSAMTLTSAPLDAQSVSTSLTATIGRVWLGTDRPGVTGTLGAGVSWRSAMLQWQAIELGTVTVPGHEAYIWDIAGDRRECRHRETNELADGDLCEGTEWTFASSAELLYVFNPSLPITVGAGYRSGESPGPYATAGVAFSPMGETQVVTRVSAGERLFEVAIGMRWALF